MYHVYRLPNNTLFHINNEERHFRNLDGRFPRRRIENLLLNNSPEFSRNFSNFSNIANRNFENIDGNATINPENLFRNLRFDNEENIFRKPPVPTLNPRDENNLTINNRSRPEGEIEEGRRRVNYPNVKHVNKIRNVDLAVQANTELHRTNRFDIVRREEVLILRRGQPFTLLLTFQDTFDPKSTAVKCVFALGPSANVIKGTKQVLEVEDISETLPTKSWGCRQKNVQGNRLWLEVIASPNAHVGVWRLEFIVSSADRDTFVPEDNRIQTTTSFKIQKPIFVLFNPWCKLDSVYLEDEEWRQEAVTRDVGKVWNGTAKKISSRMWNYGMYEENILNAVMFALDLTRMPHELRNNPIEVVRSISAIVNSADGDRGILVGSWKDYTGGTNPLDWQGSVQILQKFYATRDSVKFGQCWVFAGVLTTMLRTLGIPCRTVTNFYSAHDTNANLCIDDVFDENKETLYEYSMDSVWNFHVWNECWMTRPDLPKGYGGWQVVDGTPQERSGHLFRCGPVSVTAIRNGEVDLFRCGPVSVTAIRNGEVGLQYDTAFVFAEVNADYLEWMVKSGTKEPLFLGKDENHVGQCISCTKPNSTSNLDDDRLDITEHYKAPEKTAENKASVLKALNVANSPVLNLTGYGSKNKDIQFELQDLTSVPLGEDISITLTITNKSSDVRTITATLHLYAIFYTGVLHEKIKSHHIEGDTLQPKETKKLYLLAKLEDYMEAIKDGCNMHVTCIANVTETNQIFSITDDFVIDMPVIQIKVTPTPLQYQKACKVIASFMNPLNVPLTQAKWVIEGPGLKKPKEIPSRDIPAQKLAQLEANLTPKETGNKTILISFVFKELTDIEGYLHIQVIS